MSWTYSFACGQLEDAPPAVRAMVDSLGSPGGAPPWVEAEPDEQENRLMAFAIDADGHLPGRLTEFRELVTASATPGMGAAALASALLQFLTRLSLEGAADVLSLTCIVFRPQPRSNPAPLPDSLREASQTVALSAFLGAVAGSLAFDPDCQACGWACLTATREPLP